MRLTEEIIEKRITDTLSPQHLEVADESHLHARAQNSGSHFKVTVVSEVFQGKPLKDRHQRVYALFSEELKSGELHMLALQTWTSEEWKTKKDKPFEAPPHGRHK